MKGKDREGSYLGEQHVMLGRNLSEKCSANVRQQCDHQPQAKSGSIRSMSALSTTRFVYA